MPSILVIHAPTAKVKTENKRSFEKTLETGIGDGYAIAQKELALIQAGARVIVLDKDDRKRAEGKLLRLEPNGRTQSGIQRYDVYMENLKIVSYESVPLNRRGVAILS